jgi:hypothetical protein
VTDGTIDDPQNEESRPAEQLLLSPPGGRYIHSDVWDRLVISSDDLTGIVAYGLYQLQKREWIAYYQHCNGCLPGENEVKNYSASKRNAEITALRNNAEGMLFRFGEVIVNARLPEMQERAFNNRTKVEIAAARDELKKVSVDLNRRTGYLHHIICHVLGFSAVAVIIAIVTVIAIYDKSPREIVGVIGERLNPHDAANTRPTDAKPDVSTPPSPP